MNDVQPFGGMQQQIPSNPKPALINGPVELDEKYINSEFLTPQQQQRANLIKLIGSLNCPVVPSRI